MSNPEHSDERLVNGIRNREFLESRGYRRRTCTSCNGDGVVFQDGSGFRNGSIYRDCFACKGRGFFWDAPLR